MSRTIRLTLAAAALAAVAAPVSASAEPIIRPVCQLRWEEGWIQSSPEFPVPVSVGRPYWVC